MENVAPLKSVVTVGCATTECHQDIQWGIRLRVYLHCSHSSDCKVEQLALNTLACVVVVVYPLRFVQTE